MMAKSGVIRTGIGWHVYAARAQAMFGNVDVFVGVVGARAHEPDEEQPNVTVLDKAIWNEFGTDDGHVPPRPFLRDSAIESKSKWIAAYRVRIKAALLGRMKPLAAASQVGNIVRGDVQKKIIKGPWTPNAPSTIAAKNDSTRPLVDTGQLHGAISYEVVVDGIQEDVG